PAGSEEAEQRRTSAIRTAGPTLTENVSEHKDKIVEVEVTRFPTQSHWPAGRIVNVIGFLDTPNVETQVIIKKFGLWPGFPEEVEQEASGLPDALTEHDLAGRD